MAVSCPEVMYGAYYPYLYGRAGPSRPFYQYERFNQELYSSTAVPLTASSASTSAGSHSPCSPLLPSASASTSLAAATNALQPNPNNLGAPPLTAHLARAITKEEDLSGGNRSDITAEKLNTPWQTTDSDVTEPKWNIASGAGSSSSKGGARGVVEGHLKGAAAGGSQHLNESSCSSDPESHHGGEHSNDATRAQYLSATCVVFTSYSGDVASVVDEHFTRALNFSEKDSKEASSPMSTRNFPPSFWDSNYVPPTPAHPQVSDLYSADGGYATDPWVSHAAHYGSYAHAAHAHAAHYHHNMAQYGSLLRLPQQYGHSSSFTNRLHHDQQTAHAFESGVAAYSSYPTMAGLEAQVQESSKDLYWF